MSARSIRRTQERRLRRERRRKAAGAIGATAIGTAILAPGAAADTFTVTNLDNNGPGSLRRAVNLANGNPGLDQVVFQSSLSGVLALNSAVYIYDGVEIAGPGANQVTVDGQGGDRILSLYGLPADNRRVAVSDLTLQGGYADYGGAIYGPDADLEIARSTITGNTATYAGGAIYTSNSSLTIADTNLTNNSSDYYGGAVYASGSTISIARSTITGNTAAGAGGAVYASDSSLTLAATNLTYNSSDGGYGGGIYASGSTIAIADSNVTHNTAYYSGAGIAAASSPLQMRATTVAAQRIAGLRRRGLGVRGSASRACPRRHPRKHAVRQLRGRGGRRRLQLELVAHARRFTRDRQRLRWLRGRRVRGRLHDRDQSLASQKQLGDRGGRRRLQLRLVAHVSPIHACPATAPMATGAPSTPPAPGSRWPTAMSPITRPAPRAAASTPITPR